MASLLKRSGMGTCEPSKAFPIIASMIADKDSQVRKSALTVLRFAAPYSVTALTYTWHFQRRIRTGRGESLVICRATFCKRQDTAGGTSTSCGGTQQPEERCSGAACPNHPSTNGHGTTRFSSNYFARRWNTSSWKSGSGWDFQTCPFCISRSDFAICISSRECCSACFTCTKSTAARFFRADRSPLAFCDRQT
jgi:hypothetical protein